MKKLLDWYRLAYTARQIDERAARYIRRGMGWSYHARCSGHEGIQIALGLAFRQNKDFLFSYYRDTATVLAAGMTPLELMLNGLSKQGDTGSGGRHMSNHFAKPSIGIQSVSSCTGNHTLHAVGVARAINYYKSDGIALCSQGDSSVSEGYCFEAYNGASREKLPVLFVIQNNGYGISVPTSEQTANLCVADNFTGLKNFLIIRCDGTDFEDSDKAVQKALEFIKSGQGPAMIHAQCVRMGAHSNSDAQELYRSKEEIAEAQKHDPLIKLRALLKPKDAEKIEKEIEEELDKAALDAEAAPVPTAESVFDFALPKTSPPTPLQNLERGDNTEKLREAINRTLHEEFTHNPDTFLWGQDVASKDKGGVFNLTKGMLAKFGHGRVFNAPICEDYIVGTANGLCRFKPEIHVVIEAAQFADYVWPAMEQIVEMSHEYWRTNGQFCPNVVLRLASGGYITGGVYHSQNIEAIMSHLPGVRVVYPAFADDAAGLLRMAMRSQGMTFFLEPKYLYNRAEAKGPNLGSEYMIEFGKSRVRREGQDLTIITYGNTVHMALQVAEKLSQKHSIEVLDLRSIKPLDIDGIAASIKKTSRALIVHEDHSFNGIAGEITAQINEHCFEYLDAPVKRVAALDIPIGFSKILETAILPQPAQIEQAALNLLAY
ncbi:MAG: thiamine pyrophosphate-dependent enzyme [Myxococcaceae bacterium]